MKIFLVSLIFTIIFNDSNQQWVLWQCQKDSDCNLIVPDSFCSVRKFCECPAGYVFSTDVTECLKEQLYGEECKENIQCSHMLTGSQCSKDGECGCADEFTYVQGKCRKLKNLNEPCQEDVDCFFGYNRESVTCKAGTCQCADEFYQRFNNVCRRKSHIGEKCIVNADCNHQHDAFCVRNECVPAAKSRTDSVTTEKSIQEKRIDASVQTQSFESISDSVFHLDKSSSFSNNRHSIHYNKLNSFTSDGDATKFSSIESSVKDESTQFGDSCSEDHPCNFPHSVCLRNLCHCRDGFYESNKKCIGELGEQVSESSQCTPDVLYRRGRCVCDNHQFYHPNMRLCMKSAQEPPMGSCTQQSQCSPYGAAYCPTVAPKRCTCHEYAEYNKTSQLCEFKKGMGQYCQTDKDCEKISNTVCSPKSTCQCRPNYSLQNDECKPGFGAKCETTEDCAFKNAVCENTSVEIVDEKESNINNINETTEKYCKCNKGYIHVEDKCLEEAQNYNDTCIDSEQCKPLLGDKSSCIDGKCQCGPDVHFKDGNCNKKINLGETCDRSSECFVNSDSERAECRNSVCQCQHQYKSDQEKQTCLNNGSSKHPSPLKIITLLLIASATLITGSAIKDAYYP